MNIGITCYPVYGGSGVVATELGKALAERGHSVHFIAYSMPFRLTDHLTQNIFFHEVPVNRYPLFEYPPYALSLTSKMVDVVKHEKLDLLHVHYAIPHATSAVLARQILAREGAEVPIVTTLHGTDITILGKDPSFEPVINYSIDQSDGVTAVSAHLKAETEQRCRICNDIKVIPNFIDTDRFKKQDKRHFRQALCPNNEKVLVHVSNFRPVKRATEVVQVFHRLREEGEAVKLLLVGDGPDRPAAERPARDLGVYGDVRFLGKQEPVEEILNIADVFLMPSGSESFGLAALEAMACGVPVVAPNNGGLPELVLDDETGFLFELGDLDGFVAQTRPPLTHQPPHGRMAAARLERAHPQSTRHATVSPSEDYSTHLPHRAAALPRKA